VQRTQFSVGANEWKFVPHRRQQYRVRWLATRRATPRAKTAPAKVPTKSTVSAAEQLGNQDTAGQITAASIAHPAATPAPIAHVCRPHGKVATEFTPKLPASNVAREATKAEAARAIGPNISSTDGVVWDASRMLTFAAPPYFLKPNGASRPRFNTREADFSGSLLLLYRAC
jgi:hypothetical protein